MIAFVAPAWELYALKYRFPGPLSATKVTPEVPNALESVTVVSIRKHQLYGPMVPLLPETVR